MLKKLKPKMLLTSLIILLPIVIGLILWDRLPDQLVTHWDAKGVPNGWSSKPFAVIGLPFFLLAVHWICMIGTAADPKAQNHSEKILTLVLWICPATSLFCQSAILTEGLGTPLPIANIGSCFVGLVFIIVGNYLPKCKQNYTIGIKIPWTLNSTENWNHTHRFAGPLWVFAGILIMILCLMDLMTLAVPVMFIMILLPIFYSYWYYRKYDRK